MVKRYTPAQATEKIKHYCAYQERCHKEVKDRLFEYGLYSAQVDEIISQMIEEGFLNEERYARAYAGGKFRMKKWGRVKIVSHLELHDISKNCIKKAVSEIDPVDYVNTLRNILEKKNELIEAENEFQRREKLAKYAIQKGFESDLVWKVVKELI